MQKRTVTTINLSGKRYAPVKERLKAFHTDFPKGVITFSAKETLEGLLITCTVLNNGTTIGNAMSFTGGKVAKAVEKAQSVALGKALGYIGYYGDGEIASFEEMAEYESETNKSETYKSIAK